MNRADDAWKTDELVRTFLTGIRGGIPMAEAQIDIMLRLLDATDGTKARLLDLGCGDGVLSRAVLLRHPEARATLVDFSEPMLEAVRDNMSDLAERVEIVKADFAAPDWLKTVTPPFDAVISGYAIHHQAEARKKALFAEILTLLRPGGIFINIDHCASRSEWDRSLADKYFVDSLKTFHAREGTLEGYEEVAQKFHNGRKREADVLSTVEDQCEWLKEIGFENTECYLKVFELALFAARRPMR